MHYVRCIYLPPYTEYEAFEGTEFNETFSGRQPRQDVKFFRRFGN